jgi:protocadherin Fat 1/2/3
MIYFLFSNQFQGEYMLMVRATDHGTPPLSNTLPVHILLTMADDAPPRFGVK